MKGIGRETESSTWVSHVPVNHTESSVWLWNILWCLWNNEGQLCKELRIVAMKNTGETYVLSPRPLV